MAKKAARATNGTALLLLRDSAGKSEDAPAMYVPWVLGKAAALKLKFDGDEQTVARMVKERRSVVGDVYLDYGISGNQMQRPALDELRDRVAKDSTVSHVFVPRRDRLARPDNPMEAMAIEFEIRLQGVAIELLERSLKPLVFGQRIDLVEMLTALVEYDASGRFRTDLAEKLLLVKVLLAKKGFSIGGEPSYGFRRWLVTPDGQRDRELEFKEYVKKPGLHVMWLPTDDVGLAVAMRIKREITEKTAGRIARELNTEGLPAPHAGRTREIVKGSDYKVEFTGLWFANTVKNIAANPIYSAIYEYNKRGMGDQMRMTKELPRHLAESDFRDGKLVTVVNPPESRIVTTATLYEPLVSVDRQREIDEVLERRSKKRKGTPRTRANTVNPMGGRIFDMNCGWGMYRDTKVKPYGYSCGLNMHAQCCARNLVKGDVATRFVLAAIRQRLSAPGMMAKLKAKMVELTTAEAGADRGAAERTQLERELAKAKRDKELSGKNMALAKSEEQYRAVSGVFEECGRAVEKIETRLRSLPAITNRKDTEEVETALARLGRLSAMAAEASPEQPGVAELFRQLDAKLYLRFETVQRGRQTKSVPCGGVLAFGATPPPVPLYEGKTQGQFVRHMLARGEPVSAGLGIVSPVIPKTSPEVRSSGNVKRVTRRCTGRRSHRHSRVSCLPRRR